MELLIVVLFIGILATIAIAGYPYMREKAGDAAAKSDLKNAAVFQEEYYDDNKIYADQTALDAVLDGTENVTLTVLSADANVAPATDRKTGSGAEGGRPLLRCGRGEAGDPE